MRRANTDTFMSLIRNDISYPIPGSKEFTGYLLIFELMKRTPDYDLCSKLIQSEANVGIKYMLGDEQRENLAWNLVTPQHNRNHRNPTCRGT